MFFHAVPIFLLDSWAPEFLVNQKYSFVFHEETMYLQFINQWELLKKVFLEEIKQTEIAKEEGVSNMAITNRLKKIYAKLKKIFEKGV